MHKPELILSQFTVSELVNEISNEILVKISPLLLSPTNLSKSQQGEKILSRKEVAKLLGISLPTLHKYTLKGTLIAYRIENVIGIRYKESEVINALKKIKTKSI
jgi:predicted DNA-binding transcriptional regulator AlpA